MKISVAVVDDDKRELNNIKSLFATSLECLDQEFKADFFTDGLAFLDKFKDNYDIVMLDIEMPLIDGVTLAKKIRRTGSQCNIVFITHMPQYAIEGYEVEAIAYLLKPVRPANFVEVIKRAVKRIAALRSESVNIVLLDRNGVKSIASSDIYFIEVMDHQIIFHTVDGDYTNRMTLNSLEEQLKENFARCNSCYLVNLKYVDTIINNTVKVKGRELSVSRNKKKAFIEKYMEYMRKNK